MIWPSITGETIWTYALVGDGYVKVGRTGNVVQRVAQIQQGVPFKVELLGKTPYDVEADLHAALRQLGLRTRGEWYEDHRALRRELHFHGIEAT